MSNKTRLFDIDIDVNSGTKKTKYGVRAMVYNKDTEKILPHPSGVHITDIPVDGMTGNAAIDHELSDELGFLKVDLLTNASYDVFATKDEVVRMSQMEPDWDWFLDENIVKTLPHIANHFDVVEKVTPRSIDDLADILALIRPGKRHLLDNYVKNKEAVRRELYRRSSNKKAYFKKSHSYSYALMIVTVLNRKKLFRLK